MAIPSIPQNFKHCSVCKLRRAFSFFSKDKRATDGLQSQCKPCCATANNLRYHADIERLRTYNRERHRKNPERVKNYNLKRWYGIDLEEYKTLCDEQSGRCSICNEKGKLVVDHSHKTGKVRELLCNKCNSVLGYIKERKEVALELAKYIERHA